MNIFSHSTYNLDHVNSKRKSFIETFFALKSTSVDFEIFCEDSIRPRRLTLFDISVQTTFYFTVHRPQLETSLFKTVLKMTKIKSLSLNNNIKD